MKIIYLLILFSILINSSINSFEHPEKNIWNKIITQLPEHSLKEINEKVKHGYYSKFLNNINHKYSQEIQRYFYLSDNWLKRGNLKKVYSFIKKADYAIDDFKINLKNIYNLDQKDYSLKIQNTWKQSKIETWNTYVFLKLLKWVYYERYYFQILKKDKLIEAYNKINYYYAKLNHKTHLYQYLKNTSFYEYISKLKKLNVIVLKNFNKKNILIHVFSQEVENLFNQRKKNISYDNYWSQISAIKSILFFNSWGRSKLSIKILDKLLVYSTDLTYIIFETYKLNNMFTYAQEIIQENNLLLNKNKKNNWQYILYNQYLLLSIYKIDNKNLYKKQLNKFLTNLKLKSSFYAESTYQKIYFSKIYYYNLLKYFQMKKKLNDKDKTLILNKITNANELSYRLLFYYNLLANQKNIQNFSENKFIEISEELYNDDKLLHIFNLTYKSKDKEKYFKILTENKEKSILSKSLYELANFTSTNKNKNLVKTINIRDFQNKLIQVLSCYFYLKKLNNQVQIFKIKIPKFQIFEKYVYFYFQNNTTDTQNKIKTYSILNFYKKITNNSNIIYTYNHNRKIQNLKLLIFQKSNLLIFNQNKINLLKYFNQFFFQNHEYNTKLFSNNNSKKFIYWYMYPSKDRIYNAIFTKDYKQKIDFYSNNTNLMKNTIHFYKSVTINNLLKIEKPFKKGIDFLKKKKKNKLKLLLLGISNFLPIEAFTLNAKNKFRLSDKFNIIRSNLELPYKSRVFQWNRHVFFLAVGQKIKKFLSSIKNDDEIEDIEAHFENKIILREKTHLNSKIKSYVKTKNPTFLHLSGSFKIKNSKIQLLLSKKPVINLSALDYLNNNNVSVISKQNILDLYQNNESYWSTLLNYFFSRNNKYIISSLKYPSQKERIALFYDFYYKLHRKKMPFLKAFYSSLTRIKKGFSHKLHSYLWVLYEEN